VGKERGKIKSKQGKKHRKTRAKAEWASVRRFGAAKFAERTARVLRTEQAGVSLRAPLNK